MEALTEPPPVTIILVWGPKNSKQNNTVKCQTKLEIGLHVCVGVAEAPLETDEMVHSKVFASFPKGDGRSLSRSYSLLLLVRDEYDTVFVQLGYTNFPSNVHSMPDFFLKPFQPRLPCSKRCGHDDTLHGCWKKHKESCCVQITNFEAHFLHV